MEVREKLTGKLINQLSLEMAGRARDLFGLSECKFELRYSDQQVQLIPLEPRTGAGPETLLILTSRQIMKGLTEKEWKQAGAKLYKAMLQDSPSKKAVSR